MVEQFPEFLELQNILQVSEITWRRYGIDAGQISEIDPLTREMIIIAAGL